MSTLLSAGFIVGFMIIHLVAHRMEILSREPRSHFLSIAGGISVAYVFLHLLPELGDFQSELEGKGILSYLEHHIYLIALLGLVLFYGLEQFVKKSHKKRETRSSIAHHAGVFWIHIGSFALYNFSIGYLLVREEFTDSLGPWAFFIALGVHFITNDLSLDKQHDQDYAKYGRWVLTASILIGWLTGILTELHPFIVSYLVALLAGGIVLNVMKEELPEERESSFPAFLGGVVAYTVILLLI